MPGKSSRVRKREGSESVPNIALYGHVYITLSALARAEAHALKARDDSIKRPIMCSSDRW